MQVVRASDAHSFATIAQSFAAYVVGQNTRGSLIVVFSPFFVLESASFICDLIGDCSNSLTVLFLVPVILS